MGSVQWMKSRAAIAAIGLIPATVILASACSSGAGLGNKAGPADQPVVLRMADLNAGTDLHGTPEIQYFVQRVSDLSRGQMSVKVVYSVGGLAMNAEQQVVKDVAAGSFDLGFAGTSVFDTLGIPSFQALSAPMLIDSYPLENAVIRSSLPAKMMAGLARLDVTGLAVLGDEMRRPVGVRQPILSLADWRGITFGTYQSKTEDAAVRALGAKPGPGFATARDQALARGAMQGFDLNLVYYHQLSKEPIAPYITANVNLWPRTVALFANPGRLAKLSASQRRLVTQAAADAAVHSTGLFQDEGPVVRDICQSGGRFADASAADLQALRQSFAPVYANLEADPQTKAMIGQITAMKRSTPAGGPDHTRRLHRPRSRADRIGIHHDRQAERHLPVDDDRTRRDHHHPGREQQDEVPFDLHCDDAGRAMDDAPQRGRGHDGQPRGHLLRPGRPHQVPLGKWLPDVHLLG